MYGFNHLIDIKQFQADSIHALTKNDLKRVADVLIIY